MNKRSVVIARVAAAWFLGVAALHGCAVQRPILIKESIRTDGRITDASHISIASPQPRLTVGERVEYEVRWIGIPVGKVVSTVKEITEFRGRRAYVLELVAKTNDVASRIYRIDDVYISHMDIETLASLRHEVRRREGAYRKDAVTIFDQDRHVAYFENFLDKSTREFPIPPNAHDPLTAIYYFRTLDLTAGDRVSYHVVNNEGVYELFGLVKDKRFIELDGKTYETFYVVPYAVLGGERVKKGRASGYIAADTKRLPVLGVVQAPLFTKITASFTEARYE